MAGDFAHIPTFQPPYVGTETFPFDTGRSGGSPPQSAVASPAGLAVSGAGNLTVVTPEGTTTIDCTIGCVFSVTLVSNVDIALANPSPGQCIVIELVQDATGGWVITDWPENVTWPGGTPPSLTATPGAVDIVTLRYQEIDDVWRGTFGLAFAV